MSFAVGALVRTHGREWVVLRESEEDFLVLRPLGGTNDEIAGIHLKLEEVHSATLPLPGEHDLGDHRSGRLLRDAVRARVSPQRRSLPVFRAPQLRPGAYVYLPEATA